MTGIDCIDNVGVQVKFPFASISMRIMKVKVVGSKICLEFKPKSYQTFLNYYLISSCKSMLWYNTLLVTVTTREMIVRGVVRLESSLSSLSSPVERLHSARQQLGWIDWQITSLVNLVTLCSSEFYFGKNISWKTTFISVQIDDREIISKCCIIFHQS